MDMQIARLAQLSWLPFPDRQAFAMRLATAPHARLKPRFDKSSTQALERLPMLDWPADLFQDEICDQ